MKSNFCRFFFTLEFPPIEQFYFFFFFPCRSQFSDLFIITNMTKDCQKKLQRVKRTCQWKIFTGWGALSRAYSSVRVSVQVERKTEFPVENRRNRDSKGWVDCKENVLRWYFSHGQWLQQLASWINMLMWWKKNCNISKCCYKGDFCKDSLAEIQALGGNIKLLGSPLHF